MLFLARNHELTKNREKTYLTAAANNTATVLTVKGVDTNAWADDDYIIVGEIGQNNAEIMQINGAVADGTSLMIDRSGAGGGLRYDHAISEPVYRIDFNRVEFSRAATATGVKVVLITSEIQPDDLETRFEDTTNTTGFGFVRFNNETSANFSSYSAANPYTGYPKKSLGRIIKGVRRQLDEHDVNSLDDEDIIEEVNTKQRDVAQERLWTFYEAIRSASVVANQRVYPIDEDIVDGKVYAISVDSQPLIKLGRTRYETFFWDTITIGEITHFNIWNNEIWFYRLPSTAASASTLDGNHNAVVTTFTLVSIDGFRAPGRFVINDEVISYENVDSDNEQLLGCRRGREDTIASEHDDTNVVTERDIVYTGHEEPTELVDYDDETAIPDPMVLIYGVSMELALRKFQDQALHDRLQLKYERSLERLRDKFGQKATASYFHVRDKTDYPSDPGGITDPNRFPENIG